MKHLDYVLKLTKFAFRANPLLYLSIVISLFSVAIELLAMSSLLPLFESVSGNAPAANGLIARALILLGFAVSATTLLWAFIFLFAVRIITQLIEQTLSMYLGRRVMAQLCSGAFEQIIHKLTIQAVNEKSMGFYISLAGDESFRASTLVISMTRFVNIFVLSILYYVAIAKYSPITAVLIFAFSLCSMIALYKVTKLSHRLGGRQMEESRKTGSLFLDSLNNLKAVRAFSAEKYVVGIHRTMMFGYTKTLFLIDEVAILTKLVPILLLLVCFGGWLVWSAQSIEHIGLAFIVTMIVYLMRFFPTVGQGITLLMRIASDAKSGRDVTALLGTQLSDKALSARPLSFLEKIALQDVSFSYDENAGKMILEGINLKFEQGRSYALMGKSGIGKSTLVDLLLKFYLPTSGHLYLNNELISEVADSDVRKKIILVSQEAAIFDDTVINNICLGMDAPLSDVKAACSSACIGDVIENMVDGYNTRLQYQGKNLSGGQRQRIAIARALLRKPDVLIFDESTSALDKATQERVVGNILREYSEKIVIFVTHDPSIMDRVDEIVDVEKINFLSKQVKIPSAIKD